MAADVMSIFGFTRRLRLPRQSRPPPSNERLEMKELSISELATQLPQTLSAVADAAHELRNRIAPDAIQIGTHGHRIAEARVALAIASADLATTTAKFHRVAELLRTED
jgi:hypothetical protein